MDFVAYFVLNIGSFCCCFAQLANTFQDLCKHTGYVQSCACTWDLCKVERVTQHFHSYSCSVVSSRPASRELCINYVLRNLRLLNEYSSTVLRILWTAIGKNIQDKQPCTWEFLRQNWEFTCFKLTTGSGSIIEKLLMQSVSSAVECHALNIGGLR